MNCKGNMILAVMFVILISSLAVGVVTFSIFHSWIRAGRTLKIMETARLQKGWVHYAHHFRETLFSEDLRQYPQPETEYFTDERFPEAASDIDGAIKLSHGFSQQTLPGDGFTTIRIRDRIGVASTRNNFEIRADVAIEMVSGRIPVTAFPFFLDKAVDDPKKMFLEKVKVKEEGNRNTVVGETGVEFDTTEFLRKSLKLGGGSVTWAELRRKLGLEPSDERIPDGIYLVEEEDELACIFVQGHVRRLVFGVRDNIQDIRVVRDETAHSFEYIPGEAYFKSWDNQRERPLVFGENLIINGSVLWVEQEGETAFAEAAALTLFCSGPITIGSDLLTENLDLKELKAPGITMTCAFSKLFGPDGAERGITVDSKKAVTVDAAIITDGKLVNKSPRLKVNGSIYCKDLENNGAIELNHRGSKSPVNGFFKTVDFDCIRSFDIIAVEEVAP